MMERDGRSKTFHKRKAEKQDKIISIGEKYFMHNIGHLWELTPTM